MANCFKRVLVTGCRQTGKTTLPKHLLPDIRYITFDDPETRSVFKRDPNGFFELHGTPLILNEVQKLPEIFPYLKMRRDGKDAKGLFYLTGSRQFSLMKNADESLAGRISINELAGFSLREIQNNPFSEPFKPSRESVARHSATAKRPENIWKHMHRGSYPELSDEGMDYRYFVHYYRGRGNGAKEKEIDFLIEDNGTLYPIETKPTEPDGIRRRAQPYFSSAAAASATLNHLSRNR